MEFTAIEVFWSSEIMLIPLGCGWILRALICKLLCQIRQSSRSALLETNIPTETSQRGGIEEARDAIALVNAPSNVPLYTAQATMTR